MLILWITLGLILSSFGFVIVFGAPYLPTLKQQQKIALELLNLKPGQILYELGSGDGRMLNAAAKQGIKSVGYELNPILVVWSWLVTRRHRRLIKIVWGNFWRADISGADGVYVFLISRYMTRLDKFLASQLHVKSVPVASYGFKISSKKAKTVRRGVYLYTYGPVARRR